MSGQRILIAGGGTGGHIFPALAVANALKILEPSVSILFVGAKGKMEMEKVPQAGYEIKGLDIAGLNRSHWWKNIQLPYLLIKSFLQVRKIVNSFQPNAAFGVGGYSSFPVLKFAQAKGIPTFLHESNAFAGRSNQMLGKKATKIFVAADGMSKFFPQEKIMITGNPVRENIVNLPANAALAKESFGLQPHLPVLLVVGGSLGALSINKAILAGLDMLQEAGLQIVWQTGKYFEAVAAQACKERSGIWQRQFVNDMGMAYAAADMVVSRSGAMSVTELCMAGKPVIFVPFPFAAEDHQTANAMALVQKDAALLVKDADAAKELVPTILQLLKDEPKRKLMATAIQSMAKHNADKVIAQQILNCIHGVA